MGGAPVKVTREGRTITLPDHQEPYRAEIETYFDRYFDAVREDVTEIDFTEPRLTRLYGLDQAVWLPSITEPISDLLGYVEFAALEPGGVAIDAGGYAGITAMLLAESAGPTGIIITLEPDPVNADCLTRNLERFRGTHGYGPTLRPFALWREDGSIRFSSEGAMGSAISHYIVGRGQAQETTTICLSTIAADLSRVDYLKIDIEGAEDEALKDAAFFSEHHPRISIECHRNNSAAIEETLRGYGYETRTRKQDSSMYPIVEAY